MNNIPCIDCITFAMCSIKDEERSATGRLVELTQKCCLITSYLQLDDGDIIDEKTFAELQGKRIIGLITFFGWRNKSKTQGDQTTWISYRKRFPNETSSLKNDPTSLINREKLITYSINAQMEIDVK